MKNKNKPNKWMYMLIVMVLFGLIVGFVYYLKCLPMDITYEISNGETTTSVTVSVPVTKENLPPGYVYNRANTAQLEAFKQVNEDVAGFICVNGTHIAQPFMFTPEDETKYNRKGIDEKYNAFGVPFAAADCEIEGVGNNLVIYGHNIGYGSTEMFSDFTNYEDVEYYRSHPYITTTTETGTREWLIWGVYLIDTSDENVFRYTDYTSFISDGDFNYWYQEIMARNLLDTDIEVTHQDTFLTISTCSDENFASGTSRLAVVAKLVTNKDECAALVSSATQRENPLLPSTVRK